MQRPPKPALIMVVLVDRSFRTLSLPHRISWTDPGVTDHHNRLPEALVSRNWVWHMPHWGAPFSIRCFVQIACIPFRTFDPRINLDALDVLTTILLRCWEMQRIYTVWKRLSLSSSSTMHYRLDKVSGAEPVDCCLTCSLLLFWVINMFLSWFYTSSLSLARIIAILTCSRKKNSIAIPRNVNTSYWCAFAVRKFSSDTRYCACDFLMLSRIPYYFQ